MLTLKKSVKKEIIREAWIPLFALLIVALSWRRILSMTIQGEGFLYFSEDAYYFNLKAPFDVGNYYPLKVDLSATVITHILSRIFFDNMFGYAVVVFIGMLFVVLTLYVTLRVVVNSKLVAFFTALIFGLNFAANANMFASGGFQYFTQRVVLVAPLLISFLYLYKYIQTKSFWSYFFSCVLFLISIFLGSYATDFLPVIVLYPLVILMFKIRRGWLFFIQTIWIPLPYILGNYVMVKNAGTLVFNAPVGTHFLVNFFKTMSNFQDNIPNFLQQLAVLTLPFFWDPNILDFLKKSRGITLNGNPQLFWAQIISIMLYSTAFILLWRKKPACRVLTVFSLTAFFVVLYLNLFLNPEQSLNTFYTSRYFYYPFLMGAFFWGLFFSSMFLHKKGILKKVLIGVFLLWLGYNVFSTERMFNEEGWRYRANRDMLAKIKEWSPTLKQRPYYIYFPGSINTLGPGGLWFGRRFYAHPQTILEFNVPDLPILTKNNIKPEDIFVFRFDHQTHKVSDETPKWRAELNKSKESP